MHDRVVVEVGARGKQTVSNSDARLAPRTPFGQPTAVEKALQVAYLVHGHDHSNLTPRGLVGRRGEDVDHGNDTWVAVVLTEHTEDGQLAEGGQVKRLVVLVVLKDLQGVSGAVVRVHGDDGPEGSLPEGLGTVVGAQRQDSSRTGSEPPFYFLFIFKPKGEGA